MHRVGLHLLVQFETPVLQVAIIRVEASLNRGAFARKGLGGPACSVTVLSLRAGCLAQVTHTFSKCMLKSLHAIGVWNTAYCSTQRPFVPRVVTNFSEQPAAVVRVNEILKQVQKGFRSLRQG